MQEDRMNFRQRKYLLSLALLLIFFPVSPLYAESEVESRTSVELQISTLPEAKLILFQDFIVPVLQGDNALVKDNNIKFGMKYEVTPISMCLWGTTVFTPVAFLEFAARGMIGSGWNINLFGGEVRGMGLNVPDDEDKTSVDGTPFDGTFLGAEFGGAFQFDLAAVLPGDWNHVLFRTDHEMRAKMYSRAGIGDAWFYESDHGENQNGWTYYGRYLIGYQMPFFLNTVALQAEMEKYLYGTPNGDQWGEALGRWDFGLIMNFQFTERFRTMLVTQLRLYREYENFTYNNKDENDPDYNRYYKERVATGGGSLQFYRVAAILNYRLR
jgi:hypothetical protein